MTVLADQFAPPQREVLADCWQRAVEWARLRDADIHAVAILAVPAIDPLALWATSGGQRRLLMDEDEWVLGIGSTADTQHDGPGRAHHLAGAVARWQERTALAAEQSAPQGPLVLVSASCLDHGSAPEWGPASMAAILPQRCWWHRDGRTWLQLAARVDQHDRPEDWQRLLAEPCGTDAAETTAWSQPTQVDFRSLVDEARHLIGHGAMRKVVLARCLDLPSDAACDVLARLDARADRRSLRYAWDVPGGCFLGATPELLFEANDGHIRSIALAGSRRRGSNDHEDEQLAAELFANTKERKEHGLVVEHLVSVLRRRCRSLQSPQAPTLRTLPGVHHLETIIEGACIHHDWLEILGALHPTPAVCGLPVDAASDHLQRREGFERGLYAGSIGWMTPDACRHHVALRGALVGEDHARCYAGAGIVETSDPDDEWAETELKLAAIRACLHDTADG